MKIGLVRHYKVKKEFPFFRWVTPAELDRWFAEYDAADIHIGVTDLGGVEWTSCYSSDMPRASRTARKLYQGSIEFRSDLREIPYHPYTGGLRLPFLIWAMLTRAAMVFSPSYRRVLRSAGDRINQALDEILSSGGNVLIVSHAGLMMSMRKELLKRGFRGPKLGTPENGKLYVFEKE